MNFTLNLRRKMCFYSATPTKCFSSKKAARLFTFITPLLEIRIRVLFAILSFGFSNTILYSWSMYFDFICNPMKNSFQEMNSLFNNKHLIFHWKIYCTLEWWMMNNKKKHFLRALNEFTFVTRLVVYTWRLQINPGTYRMRDASLSCRASTLQQLIKVSS